jgi:hypothetical protein
VVGGDIRSTAEMRIRKKLQDAGRARASLKSALCRPSLTPRLNRGSYAVTSGVAR